MDTGILYIVATPIGNLGDITYRAVEVLRQVDVIFCEDTRVTKRLLDNYRINSVIKSFYGRGKGSRKPVPKTDQIIFELESGKNVAFVSDAGTPGVSDPGNQLVEEAVLKDIAVMPIPGASALTTLVSVAGIDLSRFFFLGFPPHKKGRQTFFKDIAAQKLPIIYLESPHRLLKNLKLLGGIAPDKKIILGRELTKIFEEVVRGNVSEVLEYFENNPDKVKGEIIIIIY